jgi:copper oxidase (laccase) domain-containing protein
VEAVGAGPLAAVGPGAGPCCYEVGEDVASRLRARFGDDVVRDGHADLWLCAERALLRAGAASVAVAGECTICTPDRYFSHRRDNGVTGRQGVVGLRA